MLRGRQRSRTKQHQERKVDLILLLLDTARSQTRGHMSRARQGDRY